MALDWSRFTEFVAPHERILLMTHRRPDGDGIGSQLGLAEGLRRAGKTPRIAVLGSFPERYRFLDPEGTIEVFKATDQSFARTDAVIVLDTGTWNQLDEFGDFLKELNPPTCVIDHHQTQDPIGEVRLADTSAEATGRLVREALHALNVPLCPEIATPLFVALATDTGWFRHANTTAASYGLACELVEAGADPTRLFEMLYDQNSPQRLRLTHVGLDRLRTEADGRLATTEILTSDLAETGATAADTEDLINYPRSLKGVQVAVLFVEQPGGEFKISFRSRHGVDVGTVAESFGGGGHRLASGTTAAGPLGPLRERVVRAITPLLTPPE